MLALPCRTVADSLIMKLAIAILAFAMVGCGGSDDEMFWLEDRIAFLEGEVVELQKDVKRLESSP